ncbi:MAG TPA: NADH-quinone oxidoreductase subunit L [Candidatus Binataceae bacterium]|nr:NADH-quinone oxidoreductase subunit L [Candidatus Binataceae bacterium]
MTVSFPALGLILLIPALGMLFNLFFGRHFGRAAVNFVGPAAIFATFAIGCWAFVTLLTMPPGSALAVTLWPWIEAGSFHVNFALRMDALSAVMTLIVSGVGALIHLYSAGYMAEDEDYARFFTYMNLFMLSMLILVLADNLLMMFIGWEGVGLCSYLLIAFWYTNREFAYNGRKAFIVTRIGDVGFILGILTLVYAFAEHGIWTLSFTGMQAHREILGSIWEPLGWPVATVAGLLLFAGATGKSAQIPLYVWLPDAMVGPTPVSALIHAATMVTAGVYMVVRLNFLFIMSPAAMDVIATIAALTAFFAATIALVQPDIKRVLAYSTISQIGYMLLGAGVGAFGAGIFHVMTHAFFKALLFLCAGSVMHALDGEQDMNRMGGLWRKLPITYATMLIATLAISAIPPFSGYFSKDLILESVYDSGHFGLWLLGVITAGLTSFYMFRLIFMTFHGASRVDQHRAAHIHESPPVMTIPLLILATLATCGGWVNVPKNFLWGDAFIRFLAPVTGNFHPVLEGGASILSMLALAATLAGLVFAWLLYLQQPELPGKLARALGALYRMLLDKYYIDQLYNTLVSRPLFWIAGPVLARSVDQQGIDGFVNGSAMTVENSGESVRRIETGNVQHYVLVYVLGAAAVAAYYIYVVVR